MSDYLSETLIHDIKRHLELTEPQPIGIVITPCGEARYKDALAATMNPRLRRIEPGDAPDDLALIIVLSSNRDAGRTAYAQMVKAKNKGIPVVFGLPDRRPSKGFSGPRHIGINYSGMFYLASEYLSTVRPKGVYCEFGVFDGMSFSLAYHALQGKCSHFYAFDSFQGIGGALEEENSHFKDGDYFANIETFKYNMRLIEADPSLVTATKGFFDQTLSHRTPTDYGIKCISIAHIDVDVYEPALMALEFITPALTQGSLLLFDDYDHLCASNALGERRAVREWLAKHPEFEIEPYRQYGICCRSFIVHKSETQST